jgi:hypothetical protein
MADPGTDELSQDEMALLRETFEKYKDFTFGQMKDYCHTLPEYDDSVGKGSKPISIAKMFQILGRQEQLLSIADSILEAEKLRTIFGE